MTAMAHYGMYVNDTDGIDNIELEAESDISYTSLGGPPSWTTTSPSRAAGTTRR